MKFLSITQRLTLIVCLLVGTVALLVTADTLTFRQSMLQERRDKLRDIAATAVTVMKRYDDLVGAGKMSLAEAQDTVRTVTRAMRWGKGDYFSIYTTDGMTLVHANPAYENVNRIDFVDGSGQKVVRQQIDIAASGGGFLDVMIPRAGETTPVPKMNYSVAFTPWKWAIFVGAYVDDIDAVIRHRLMLTLGFSAAALVVIAGAVLLIGRSISRPIRGLSDTMQAMAKGRTDLVVPYTG